MPALHLSQATDELISEILSRVTSVSVTTFGRLPLGGLEPFEVEAGERLSSLKVADVREQLEHDLQGSCAEEEIMMAISIACEGDNWPNGLIVELSC